MVLVKIFKFSFSLFFFKIGRNILFYFVLKKKHFFLDYKNDIRTKWKICHFSKVKPMVLVKVFNFFF